MSWVNGKWVSDATPMFTGLQNQLRDPSAIDQYTDTNYTSPFGYGGSDYSRGNSIKFSDHIDQGGSGDIGWNTGTFGAIGDIFQGVGSLGQAYAALGQLGVAKRGLEQKRQGWNANYAAQATTTNNPIRMQQAMLTSDFYNDPERAKQLKLVQPATIG